MSMCVGGEIKVWPTVMSKGTGRSVASGHIPAVEAEFATATYTSWTEESNSAEAKGRGKLSIFASIVQPNDHVWAVGTEHIRAWALV